jgi:hypothetical protein
VVRWARQRRNIPSWEYVLHRAIDKSGWVLDKKRDTDRYAAKLAFNTGVTTRLEVRDRNRAQNKPE